MLGILIGRAYAIAAEWAIHKYFLHGLGKDDDSVFAFHWHDHHRAASVHGMYDTGYEHSVLHDSAQRKEAIGLALLVASHLPLFPVAPFFVGTLAWSARKYYIEHKRAHLDLEWTRENLPWHYDHHMGRNQDANWGVTSPLADIVMGTRVPFAGTEEEARKLPSIRRRYEKAISPEKIIQRESGYVPNTLERIVDGARRLTQEAQEIQRYLPKVFKAAGVPFR